MTVIADFGEVNTVNPIISCTDADGIQSETVTWKNW